MSGTAVDPKIVTLPFLLAMASRSELGLRDAAGLVRSELKGGGSRGWGGGTTPEIVTSFDRRVSEGVETTGWLAEGARSESQEGELRSMAIVPAWAREHARSNIANPVAARITDPTY